jgi:hypothetical protein
MKIHHLPNAAAGDMPEDVHDGWRMNRLLVVRPHLMMVTYPAILALPFFGLMT